MPKYDLYRSVHKFIRWRLFQFGEALSKVDFRELPAVEEIKKEYADLAFDLRMHAAKEEQFFTPLFEAKNSTVHERVADAHANQDAELSEFQAYFDQALNIKDNEVRIEQGCNICSFYDEFLASNLLHFNEEEMVLMPELWRLYSDDELQQVVIDSYKGLPEHVLLGSVSFFPVLNSLEKHTYLQDLKSACSNRLFHEIWKISVNGEGCFTPAEKAAFAIEFNLP